MKTYVVYNVWVDQLTVSFFEGEDIRLLPGEHTVWCGPESLVADLQSYVDARMIDVWVVGRLAVRRLVPTGRTPWQREGF